MITASERTPLEVILAFYRRERLFQTVHRVRPFRPIRITPDSLPRSERKPLVLTRFQGIGEPLEATRARAKLLGKLQLEWCLQQRRMPRDSLPAQKYAGRRHSSQGTEQFR
jgi:hypothetical protein